MTNLPPPHQIVEFPIASVPLSGVFFEVKQDAVVVSIWANHIELKATLNKLQTTRLATTLINGDGLFAEAECIQHYAPATNAS